MYQPNAFVRELVNLSTAIGTGVGALLLRPGHVAVWFACQERQPVDEVIETAAAQGLQVVGG